MLLQGKNEAEIEMFGKFFSEAQKAVDSKQLRPMIRTQYMRTAFQIPFDSTVRVSLDTNLVMIKENPTDGPTCHVAGRCAHAPGGAAPAGICGYRSDAFLAQPLIARRLPCWNASQGWTSTWGVHSDAVCPGGTATHACQCPAQTLLASRMLCWR